MDSIDGNLEGAEERKRDLARIIREQDNALPAALYTEGNETMNESKQIVPVARPDLSGYQGGRLRASGFVRHPDKDPEGWRVDLGYGTSYGLYVHEIPPPELGAPHPAQIEPGTRTARHRPPEQWKFLENPLRRRAPDIEQRIDRVTKKLLDKYSAKE